MSGPLPWPKSWDKSWDKPWAAGSAANPGGPERGFPGTTTVNVLGWQTIHRDASDPGKASGTRETANSETVKPPRSP